MFKTAVGVCKYCGQTRALSVPESYEKELIDEEATKQCDCTEAQTAQRIEETINHTLSEIEKFFEHKEGLGTFKNLLILSVPPLAKGDIEKISINRDEYSVTMKKGKDGIDVRITHKTVEAM